MRKLKESTGNWNTEKSDLTELDLVKQDIFLVMNQLTVDSFESLKDRLVKHIEKYETC